MRGMNYGHHWTAASYSERQVFEDFYTLLSHGYTHIRIAYPSFDAQPATIDMCKNMVTTALAAGFERVIWGVTGHRPMQTAAHYTAYAAYVAGPLASWAESLASTRFQLSVGNEEEMHVDFSSTSVTQIQTDVAGLLTRTRAAYSQGPVDYTTSVSYKNDWRMLGVPADTRLGMNVYYELPAYASFYSTIKYLKEEFGSDFFVAEYNTSNGYEDSAELGPDAEQHWAEALVERRDLMNEDDIEHYAFCYQDGEFGVPADSFGMIKTDGTRRLAWYLHSDTRPSGERPHSEQAYSGI